ncbi:MAG: MFS transporter [Arenibacterium sp.]
MTTSRNTRLVIPVLSGANFMIGMGAFMVIGLLNPVAEDFAISPARAGLLMTLYAMSYAILSPLLVSLTGAVGRRRILAGGLTLFAFGNLLAAFAPNDTTLFFARILAASGAGLVTPVAASVAAGLSEPGRQARALAAVFFGLTLAQVLGVPAGSYIAFTFGWRVAFFIVFALSLPIVALIWFFVPAGLAFQPVSIRDLGRTLISPRQMVALLFTLLFVGGTYVVYTYISPLLGRMMGFERDGITLILLLFGLGAVVGNLLGGQLSDRIGTVRTLCLLAIVQACVLPGFSALPLPVVAVFALSFVWSAFGWSFTAPQQARLIGIDPENASVMLALNAGCIYLGSALGSWIGGMILSASGNTPSDAAFLSLGWAGGGVALASLGVIILSHQLERRHARQ